jgi:hypothetical protein
MLLTYIQKIPGLNHSWDGDSPEVFHGFIQSFQVNTDIFPQIRLGPLLSTFLPVHYSLIILPFNAVLSELAASLNKP